MQPFKSPFHRATYLTGPTASGKTAVAVALARLLDAEVVALDSMTLYRGMDVGTAKPTEAERQGVPHHLIDVLNPWESASVADYLAMAAKAISAIELNGKRALFVGGTPLYLKALLRGLFDGPAADLGLRRDLEKEADTFGDLALHARLAVVDPVTADRLHPNDRRRVVRALEVATLTGRPLSHFQKEHDTRGPEGVPVFALARPRKEICDRIDRRVVQMFEAGFVDEVQSLITGPKPLHKIPAQGVGYREVIDFLNAGISLKETVVNIQARTRQFAKRQGTWFRGLIEVCPFPVIKDESPETVAHRLAIAIEAGN